MAKQPFPQDRGWAWATVLGGFLCVFFMVGTSKSIGLFLTEFQTYFDIPLSLAAMVPGSGAIVYAFLAPVFIMLGQMFTVRKVILVGGLIGFIGMSLGSLMISIDYLIAVFGICFGISSATIYGNVLVILGVYFRKHLTLANALALSGASIGQFALPPLIEYLLEAYGLQGSILLLGGLYFHIVAAACLFRPPSIYASTIENLTPEKAVEENSTQSVKGNGHIHHNGANGNIKEESVKSTSPLVPSDASSEGTRDDVDFRDKDVDSVKESEEQGLLYRSFMASTGSLCIRPLSKHGSTSLDDSKEWLEPEEKPDGFCHRLRTIFDFSVMKSYIAVFLLITCFLCFFGYFNFIIFLPAHVMTQGIDKYKKAILVSLCGIGDLVGRLIIGVVGDRNFVARYKLMAAGNILIAINIGAMVLADTFGWMAVHCFLYGVAGGVYVSLLAVVVVDFVGLRNMPRLLAVVMLLQGIGSALGQPLLGAVKDETDSFVPILIICSVCSFLGGLILFAYPLVLRLENLLSPERRLLPDTVTVP